MAVRAGLSALAWLALLATAASAGPLEERKACWETYAICVTAAYGESAWRSICYSDYTVCMRNLPEIACSEEAREMCEATRGRCQARSGGAEDEWRTCSDDYSVCLDALGC